MIFDVLLGIFLLYVVPMIFLKFLAGFAEAFSGKYAEPGSFLDMAYVPVMNLLVTVVVIIAIIVAIVVMLPAHLFNKLGKYVGRKLS